MAGANHLDEVDRSPPHLCPVCLRKLYHAAKFDPSIRYQALGKYYKKHGLKEESDWIDRRLGVKEE